MADYTFTGTSVSGDAASVRYGTGTYLTLGDVTEHLRDWLVGRGPAVRRRTLRHAAIQAYNALIGATDWPHLRRLGRVAIYAPYTTGTVTFDADAGTLTLASGTWPSWAATGVVDVDGVEATVLSRTSDAVLQMDTNSTWTADFSAESYSISPLYYQLPANFQRTPGPVTEDWGFSARHTTLDEILRLRRLSNTTGEACLFTVAGDPNNMDRSVLYVYPYPSTDSTLDFTYKAKPQALRFDGEEAAASSGTISISAGGTVVTGSGTAFISALVGSVLRVGTSSQRPAGNYSDDAPVEELVIQSVESTTQVTVATAASAAASGAKYTISDPVDLPAVCHPALYRAAEYHVALVAGVGISETSRMKQAANLALREAMAAVSTYMVGTQRSHVTTVPRDTIVYESS